MAKKVFGLVGPIACGKGTVAKILADKGYKSYSLSDRIREEIISRGLEINRQTLNQVSNDLRKTLGTFILAKRTVDLVERDNPQLVVIDAIRNPEEITFLKNNLNARIIGINASQERRYELFSQRGTNNAGITTFEQFKDLDDQEWNGTSGAHSQRVSDCMNMADILIENSGNIEELTEKITKIVSD